MRVTQRVPSCRLVGLAVIALTCAGMLLTPVHAQANVQSHLDPNLDIVKQPLVIHNLYWDTSWDANNPGEEMYRIDDATSAMISNGYLVSSDQWAALWQYDITDVRFSGSNQADPSCGTAGPVVNYGNLSDFILCEKHKLDLGPPATANVVYMTYVPRATQFEDFCLPFDICAVKSCGATIGPASAGAIEGFHYVTYGSLSPYFDVGQFFGVDFTQCDQSLASQLNLSALDLTTVTGSHELVEAATDPSPLLGWIDNAYYTFIGAGGPFQLFTKGEAADLCEQQTDDALSNGDPTRVSGANGNYAVAYYWSNLDNACVPFSASVSLGESGLPAGVAATATVDGISQSLPFSENVILDSVHCFGFPSPIPDPVVSGTRYVTDAPASSCGNIEGPDSFTAQYQSQHLVSFAQAGMPASVPWSITVAGTSHPGPFSNWINHGSSLTFSYESPVPDSTSSGTRYILAATSEPSPLVIANPLPIVGAYQTQYALNVSTLGLGGAITHIYNGTSLLGTAADSQPVTVWLAQGSAVSLIADALVTDANGTQLFFQNFSPSLPSTLSAPFSTTAVYSTVPHLIAAALAEGQIDNAGVANALAQEFSAAQASVAATQFDSALGAMRSFEQHVRAQAGKHLTNSIALTLRADALLSYHQALCAGVAAGLVGPVQAAADYEFYSAEESDMGFAPLPNC